MWEMAFCLEADEALFGCKTGLQLPLSFGPLDLTSLGGDCQKI